MEPTRTCQACGADIPRNPKWSLSYYTTRLYCDRTCRSVGRPDIASDYTVTNDGCWEWQGHVDRNGYGKAYDASMPQGRRVDWAHRVSYRRHVGAIPAGMELDHLCNNPPCVNPDHLEPVTRAENIRRAVTRAGTDGFQQVAARLRAQGLTYAEIAEVMGLAGRTSAAGAVNAAIRKGIADPESVPRRRTLHHEDREDIRALYALGIPQTEIGAWYSIDSSQVSRICNGMTSGHSSESVA